MERNKEGKTSDRKDRKDSDPLELAVHTVVDNGTL
jgi:hypothetical protein